jgi:sugar O-acyltransferase (sialic acid O-acetyltransferase NeuD family)
VTERLVLVGAGGLGRETAEAVQAINDVEPTWDLLGFLDDGLAPGTVVDGLEVVGPVEALAGLGDVSVTLCTARPDRYWSRPRLVDALGLERERYATIAHPGASLGRSVRVGAGSILLAGVVATAGVDVGDHVAVMPGCIFTHDDRIDAFATFGAGVRLAGGVRVGAGAYVGSGVMVREGAGIGAWSLVGMGSVVLDDVPAREVWAGSPARRLRAADVPDDLPE